MSGGEIIKLQDGDTFDRSINICIDEQEKIGFKQIRMGRIGRGIIKSQRTYLNIRNEHYDLDVWTRKICTICIIFLLYSNI